MIDVNSLAIGQTIAFKTINQYDNVEWRGVIKGFGDYELISNMQDVLPYYQNVKKTNPSMAPITNLNYIVLDAYENVKTINTNRRVFAKEWIDPSSLKIINIYNYLDIRVLNVEADQLSTVLTILNDHGYSCAQHKTNMITQ